jgi:single-stranded-DNA-specific exonuclease
MNLSTIKNMAEAADYIRSMPRQKKIVVYGDEDIDGITSVIIIKESLERLGFQGVEAVFCLQEEGGHGFSSPAFHFVSEINPDLIVLVDLGISDHEPIRQAKEKGIDVVVIDHHEPLSEDLPNADFIINPKQPEDPYPFKQLAAGGLCYHFALWLLKDDLDVEIFDSRFVELAGLATLADMMPQSDDNLEIINQALESIVNTSRESLRVLLERYFVEESTLKESIYRIIGVLNASMVNKDRKAESFILITENRRSEINKIIDQFELRVAEYLAMKEEIILEAERRLAEEGLSDIIFIGDDHWPRRTSAAIATRLANTYQRPSFVYYQGEKNSRGSVRAPEGINCVDLLSACSGLLVNFGGHPPAAGFEVKNKDLQKLRLCLIENYRKLYG